MAIYAVKPGDTLSAIAKKYGTTYQEIAKANGISDPNKIYAGQTLNIGGNDSPSTSQPTGDASANTETKAPSFEYEAYKPSDVVIQAEALLQQQLANKPGEYTSAWQTQLNDTLNKILNREKFSYDLNGDALYQQYKDQYTTQGKMAMMDTMGQAAAMTGGYGNSYAQSVGQQAFQGYLQQLNDRIPELYQLALNQYNAEGDEMYNQAALMAQQEEQDYGRYRDTVGDYYTELDRLTDDARYQAELDYGKWGDGRDFAYGQFVDDRNLTYQQERDKIADAQWQAQFDEAKRQYDQQYALSKAKASYTPAATPEKKPATEPEKEPDTPVVDPEMTAAEKKALKSKFETSMKIHPESQHDAVMRDKWGSYRQYLAYKIEHSGLSQQEQAVLIGLYGIQESDTYYKQKKDTTDSYYSGRLQSGVYNTKN